jgi:hypothetical protein
MSFQSANANIDEFGRDLDLKNHKEECDFMTDFYRKLNSGMSWAEICYAQEEEEEEEERKKLEEKQKEDMEKHKKETEIRRHLYTIGEYELEEGEIFE